MLNRHLIVALTVGLVVVAAGCIDYEETIRIDNESGAGQIEARARFPIRWLDDLRRLGPYAPLVEGEDQAQEYLASRNMQLKSWKLTEGDDTAEVRATVAFNNIAQCSDPKGLDAFGWNAQPAPSLARKFAFGKEPLDPKTTSRDRSVDFRLTVTISLPRDIGDAAFKSDDFCDLMGNEVTWTINGEYIEQHPNALTLSAKCLQEQVKHSSILFKIIVYGIIALMIVGGYSSRLYGAAGTFIAVFLANAVAMNLFEPLARLVGRSARGLNDYADALMYVLLFFGVFIGLQIGVIARRREWLSFNPNLDRVLSLAFGLLTGLVMAGFISTFYFLLPFKDDFIGETLTPEDPAPYSVEAFRHCANHFSGKNAFDPIGRFPSKYCE